MKRSLGFGFERPGLWAVAAPKTAVLFLVGLIALASFLLPNLRFEEDINRVFLSQSERSQAYRNFIKQTGGEAPQFIVLVEKATPFTKPDYEALRSLAFELEFIDGVETSLSPFAVRFPPLKAIKNKSLQAYAGQALLPDNLDVTNLDDRLKAFAETGGFLRPMITTDKTSLLFVVGLTAGTAKARVREVIQEISEATKQLALADVSTIITGEAVIAETISDALQTDLLKLNFLGSSFVVVLTLIYFRNWKLALLAVVPTLLGAVASLTVFAALGFPITVISNVVPLLVLILGIADSMHLVSHLRDSPEPDLKSRIKATIVFVGPACALTAITTSIAFFAISITDNAQLFEFAVAGGVSVLVSFVVVICAFGAFAVFLAPAAQQRSVKTRKQTAPVLRPFFWSLTVGKGKVLAVAAVLFLGGAIGYANTTPWFPYEDQLPRSSSLKEANDRLLEAFGGIHQLYVEVPVTRTENAVDAESWARLSAVDAAIAKLAPDYPIVSAVRVARWLGDDTAPASPEDAADLPPRLMNVLLPENQSVARIIVQVPEPMRDLQTQNLQDKIETAVLEAGASASLGTPIIMRHEAISIVSQLGRGLFLACLGACLVIAFAFRRVTWAALLLLPNLLPLLITGAGLHWLNQGQLSPTAVLALTIAFGIAVDDSIHFLNSYVGAKDDGVTTQQALRRAMEQSGTVILATTVLLCLGLTVTLLSAFNPIQLFGTMLMVTFITAVFADLIFLPALLRLGDRER